MTGTTGEAPTQRSLHLKQRQENNNNKGNKQEA